MKSYLATMAIGTAALIALWAGCTWMAAQRPHAATRPAATATQPSTRPAPFGDIHVDWTDRIEFERVPG